MPEVVHNNNKRDLSVSIILPTVFCMGCSSCHPYPPGTGGKVHSANDWQKRCGRFESGHDEFDGMATFNTLRGHQPNPSENLRVVDRECLWGWMRRRLKLCHKSSRGRTFTHEPCIHRCYGMVWIGSVMICFTTKGGYDPQC